MSTPSGHSHQSTRPDAPSEYTFSLERHGRKWAFLYVKSRSTASSAPVFHDNATISGRVEVDLAKPENFKGISISIHAGTTAVGQEEAVFLQLTQDLWSSPNKSSTQLNGKHSWPFELTLPSQVVVTESKAHTGTYFLPPNFSERASPVYIDYKFVVTFRRGRFTPNQTLSPYFAYVPLRFAQPPTPLRQLALREGSPLLGPNIDPEGWQTSEPIKISGVLFNTKRVEAECTLSIAKPLSYAIRTPIPLTITFECSDRQALDLLANPRAVRLFLVRSIATGANATGEDIPKRSNNFFLEGVGQAVFWPSSIRRSTEETRSLQGELNIKSSLKPTFVFPRISISYSLDLLPFEPTGFSPSSKEGAILLSQRVEIMTRPAPGVITRSYAPPGYEGPDGGDYNRAIGFRRIV
ncbi:hypothetical protein EDD18DRAFT_1149347 [Armillaria luteobubalina]|uniref:Arrestin-like N-terminal domain-containing protein n=1 Tax=Armillaria luteobubalina TaxID=153913 RepID=A0AA39QCC3_9AGAR|nr:hypothetical protein EDD18DRAFT_1149347 [Armillaria luteobubalina]